jgi:16S rRNA (adenine1518-N6/adenine1519-N6)-dimethyltransferase
MFKIKKKYGQNFLISKNIAQKICNYLKIEGQNIIEIGPGNLALTEYILSQNPKKFLAIEIDNEIVENYKGNSTNYIKYIVNEDALKFDEINFFKTEKFFIISNLPFNISSKLLIKWIKLQYKTNSIKGMVLMFQKELGERIISDANTKKYGRLSILSQSVFEVKKEIIVKKENFKPSPKVDAIILKFVPIKKKREINFDSLEKITNIFFNTRRKINNKKIKQIFSEDVIKKNNLYKLYNLRPENISKEMFYKMSNLL